MKDLMTDEQVEAEIDRLNASEDVQLAQYKAEQQLKAYCEKTGKNYDEMHQMIFDTASNIATLILQTAHFIQSHQEVFSSYSYFEVILHICNCLLDCSSNR